MPNTGGHHQTTPDRGCELHPRCLTCPREHCKEELPPAREPRHRTAEDVPPAVTYVRYAQCSCGLTEEITIWRGVVILTKAFQQRHAGHQLLGIGVAVPEDVLLGSQWGTGHRPYLGRESMPRKRGR